jgi:hypothetical protein
VSQSVQSATNDAMQSATTRAHKVIQSARTPDGGVRLPDGSVPKDSQAVKPGGVTMEAQGAKPQ